MRPRIFCARVGVAPFLTSVSKVFSWVYLGFVGTGLFMYIDVSNGYSRSPKNSLYRVIPVAKVLVRLAVSNNCSVSFVEYPLQKPTKSSFLINPGVKPFKG